MKIATLVALPPLAIALAACNGNSATANGGTAKASGDQPSSGQPFAIAEQADFDNPWAIVFLPGTSQALVTEKTGHLQLYDTATKTKREVAGIPAVDYGGQGGLLDVALAPDFVSSRRIYLSYAEPGDGGSGLALARGTLAADGSKLSDVTVVWRQLPRGKGGQFGGVIAFAPDGQSLYLTSGERQRFTPAQDPDQALGKIVHLTLDGQPAANNPMAGKVGAQSVTMTDPPRNTGAATTAKGRSVAMTGTNTVPAETWSSGHRNPYGLTFSPDGRLWEIEMGPRGGDELNQIEAGKNYGWPNVSFGDNYDGSPIPRPAANDGYALPALYWVPSVSPAGLLYYSGDMFPAWKGSLLLGALSGESLIRVTIDGGKPQKADRWELGRRIRDVQQGPDGAIWLLEDGDDGKLLKLTPR
ncbi:PQQ-dependent sugar dehydrogenase [Sphingorhabdus soli]|uniref:PQQ-dependent sugar dehydrogenase n=1 Tax=Flavisphingopyxis soli TaxID=2601267 RepID=A0A5C6U904_9SPHN|nr:PQQ-dependent sugar dehydrogenase [Sphingorhabdus soli]TXC68276.1 PQQ-dependent sugar dehydrogenase [Sphingorhabdus soli]